MKVPSSRVWIIVLLLLSLSVAVGQPLATAAPATTDTLDQLVGSWAVEVTVVQQDAVFPALITFTSDGLVLADEPPMPIRDHRPRRLGRHRPGQRRLHLRGAHWQRVRRLVGEDQGDRLPAIGCRRGHVGRPVQDSDRRCRAGPRSWRMRARLPGTRIAVETVAPAALTAGRQDRRDDAGKRPGPH